MKRIGHLMPQIADYENLLLAHYKAQRGKKRKPAVQEFAANLDANLQALRQELLSGEVAVGDYHYFTIYDPKERQICAAAYRERVLHHALMNVCAPHFEAYQIYDSYATRVDKGAFKALDRAWGFQKRHGYYLKADIRKYFDSIDHATLLSLLTRRFKDPGLLALFGDILASYETAPSKGVPIGNLTSQFFANHYLGLLDHWIKDDLGMAAYVRYMDDFVCWHNDKGVLTGLAQEMTAFLANTLQLTLKTCYVNKCAHGLPFLGFRLFPHKKLLAVRSKRRYRHKMQQLVADVDAELVSQVQAQVQATAMNAFVDKAFAKKYRKRVLDKQK